MSAASVSFPIMPGDWLGMMGGGQLGRMFCQAAQSMGYKVAVLDPGDQCPAGMVANLHIRTAYDDIAGLERLSERCRAITTEFENVPAASLKKLAERSSVTPSAHAVSIAQDRIAEKSFIEKAGVPVAPHSAIYSTSDIDSAPGSLFPGILKTARLGYDGKGQARVTTREQARDAFASFKQAPCVLEALMPLAFEISVVLARGLDGRAIFYIPAVNEHRNGILAISRVAEKLVDASLHQRAANNALAIAEGLNYCGVLCVEFFVLQDGSLVANEIAPRPHNSGHYSINACVTSQFEQQVRVMAGLPLGSTRNLSPSIMLNIMGDAWFDRDTGEKREPDWLSLLAAPGAKLHLYDKSEARRGRKMGHVTVLGATLDDAHRAAAHVARVLGIAF
jgi:5-(carboxyamino)imidazole ribonucleotide synthase